MADSGEDTKLPPLTRKCECGDGFPDGCRGGSQCFWLYVASQLGYQKRGEDIGVRVNGIDLWYDSNMRTIGGIPQ